MNECINQSINDEAVYRTAPATPGLLIMYNRLHINKKAHGIFQNPKFNLQKGENIEKAKQITTKIN